MNLLAGGALVHGSLQVNTLTFQGWERISSEDGFFKGVVQKLIYQSNVALWYIKYLVLAVDREILLVTVAMKNLLLWLCRFKVRLQSG